MPCRSFNVYYTMREEVGSIRLKDLLTRKIFATTIVISAFLLIVIFTFGIYLTSELTGEVSHTFAYMIRMAITSKIQALREYDKRIEKRIKPLIANLPGNFRDLQKELCEKIEDAERCEVVLFRSNGEIVYPNAKGIEIIKPVLDEIKSLKPGESLFEKLEQEENGEFVKKGFVKISKNLYMMIRIFLDQPEIEKFEEKLADVGKRFSFIKRASGYTTGISSR